MLVDSEVNQRKYDCELKRLRDQRLVLETRGIFLLASSTYPHIDLFFAPRHHLRATVPGVSPPNVTLPPNAVALVEYPSLSVRGFKARFDLSDYDIRPPSLDFLDPWTNEPLKYETMFRALEFEQTRGPHLVLLGDHPLTHRPFLCLRGVREYHEHPQHTGDDWFLYRDTVTVFSVVMSLWRVSIDLVHPQLSIQPNAIPQLMWTADGKA